MKPNYVIAISKGEAVKITMAKWQGKWWHLVSKQLKFDDYRHFYLVHHFRTKISRAFQSKLQKVNKFIYTINLGGEDRLMMAINEVKGFRDMTPERVEFT